MRQISVWYIAAILFAAVAVAATGASWWAFLAAAAGIQVVMLVLVRTSHER